MFTEQITNDYLIIPGSIQAGGGGGRGNPGIPWIHITRSGGGGGGGGGGAGPWTTIQGQCARMRSVSPHP